MNFSSNLTLFVFSRQIQINIFIFFKFLSTDCVEVLKLFQKEQSRDVLRKRCSKNMQQIYRRTLMLKCDFNKVTLLESLLDMVAFLFFFWCIFLEDLFLRTPLDSYSCFSFPSRKYFEKILKYGLKTSSVYLEGLSGVSLLLLGRSGIVRISCFSRDSVIIRGSESNIKIINSLDHGFSLYILNKHLNLVWFNFVCTILTLTSSSNCSIFSIDHKSSLSPNLHKWIRWLFRIIVP